ncbi:hypothetical protein L6452_02014 [Arctium lappa]|uniref:Uncharacterized protein n=1 Tax=Arctium lappa TaxID=4217 RepID=A0ACB9FJ50_ARCLA|nr:hypothetical protein L6452_02014 [Arctium lappa]
MFLSTSFSLGAGKLIFSNTLSGRLYCHISSSCELPSCPLPFLLTYIILTIDVQPHQLVLPNPWQYDKQLGSSHITTDGVVD